MSNHSSHSRELLLVSILGALLGGTATSLLMSKEGKKFQQNVKGMYHDVKDNIDDILHTLEEKIEENVDQKSEEWSRNARETVDKIKAQVRSVNHLEPKELGMIILAVTLLGVALGVGTTLIAQDKTREHDIFHGIASRVSSAKPLLNELHTLLNESSKCSCEHCAHTHPHATSDLMEFALLGLKLWDRVKHRSR
ncbi:MAG: YtxH domain-containing protein [Chlamydiales bacterium]|nr:YtxH domain-containing protein [Chlamydiia bacterium]MCP5507140.1 YtxH domain-containing protein [Chlamydiales bacterium]